MQALGVTAEELLACGVRADTLKFHAIPDAKILCTDSRTGEQKVGSLRGPELTVTFADSKVTVNNTTVTTADVITSNRVIHTTGEVLLPPADLADVVDIAVAGVWRGVRGKSPRCPSVGDDCS